MTSTSLTHAREGVEGVGAVPVVLCIVVGDAGEGADRLAKAVVRTRRLLCCMLGWEMREMSTGV